MENIEPKPISPHLQTLVDSVHYAPSETPTDAFSPEAEKIAENDED